MASGNGPKAVGGMMPGGRRWVREHQLWIPEIDKSHRARVDSLKKELDVERRGADDAKIDRPDTSDRTLNEPQLQVCNRVFSGILMLNQFLAEQLGKALEQARARKPAPIDLNDFRSKMNYETRTVFAENAARLASLKAADVNAHVDLRYFQSVHKLRRSASYRESAILSIGILVAMLVFESFANSLLFRDIVPNGILGGAFLALLISAINVIMGVSAGLIGWRYIGHATLIGKAIGWVVTILLHAAAFFWNLLIAHFREAAGKASASGAFDFDLGGLATQSWTHISENGWFGLTSLFAWALFALGIVVHFVAAHEGWDDMADRYPGYKKADQRAKEARADFEAMAVEMRRDARKAADEVLGEAEAVAGEADRRSNAIAALEDLARQREKEVRDSEDEWVAGGTELLKTYRDSNVQVREEATAPAYFAIYPTSDDYRRNRFSGTGSGADDIDKHAEQAQERLAALDTLKVESQAVVEANSDTVTSLRSHVNVILEALDSDIETAKTQAQKDAAQREGEANGGAD